jgi:ParB family transcriptional regulator, chromosome partitioning protein
MSTMTVVAPSKENERPLIQEISIATIKPSKANPRRRVDESALAELAESIRSHGVLQPVLIRPLSAGGFELVCGERRWKASKMAAKQTIPARIVNLTDAEALEVAVIENLQREDVHELDEANGYKSLMHQNLELYTVETIAAKVGRSPSYVYQRLKLAELAPSVQTAFYAGKLTAGHAIEIARLQPHDQEEALRECFPGQRTAKAILKEKDPRPISVRELRDWIQREIHLSLANAPFDLNDASLLPSAGACSTCLKRSGSNPLLFADSVKRADVCIDRHCFAQKREALIQIRLNELEKAGEKPVKVSESFVYYGHKAEPGVIYRPDFNESKAGECRSTTVAVAVEGKRTGSRLYVCTNKKCPTHAPAPVGLSPEAKAERQKQAHEQRTQQEYRKRVLQEIFKRVPAQLRRHELDFIALSYFNQVGHDNHHRIFKFFGWEESKNKSEYGGSVDYPNLASAKLDSMTPADLGKILMVCALASELYFSPYIPSGGKLAKEAQHYRVNAEKLLREVKEKFAGKPSKAQAKLQTSAKAKTGSKKR